LILIIFFPLCRQNINFYKFEKWVSEIVFLEDLVYAQIWTDKDELFSRTIDCNLCHFRSSQKKERGFLDLHNVAPFSVYFLVSSLHHTTSLPFGVVYVEHKLELLVVVRGQSKL
jgi:hypothetical protein